MKGKALHKTSNELIPDAARLGNPSFVWRSGQQRRLNIMKQHVMLSNQKILDLGCGLGEYVRAFSREGGIAIGCDIEVSRVIEARGKSKLHENNIINYLVAQGENLPFLDNSLDVVVMNEVIEHVSNDRTTLKEINRVLRNDGSCVIFAPNKLFPFETHGIYVGKKYIFGNIPFINWLPGIIRNKLVPHAKAYGHQDWSQLIEGTDFEITEHTYVYPGFDNLEKKLGMLGRIIRKICYWAEKNWLRRFGLSHFLVLVKTSKRD
tara:strand:- start:1867 stop:2655 length:789 start_codon:yes stop_codon:yes gene_type:complete